MKKKDKKAKKRLERILDLAEGRLTLDDLDPKELQLVYEMMMDIVIQRQADPLLPSNTTIH